METKGYGPRGGAGGDGPGGTDVRRIDISMPLQAGMAAFPGDPDFSARRTRSVDQGDPYNLSTLEFGSHAGTHLDPPRHFLPAGLATDQLDLAVLNGPCVVLGVDPHRESIGPEDLVRLPVGTQRVLFRTRNSDRWHASPRFFPDYVALSLAAADSLLARGVRLVGIDSLSVESDPSGEFPVHHLLLGHGVPILEGLQLYEAPPGSYELACLPLRLTGGDGGPARAILLPL